jgi:uncharacterized protein (DUF3084 family)
VEQNQSKTSAVNERLTKLEEENQNLTKEAVELRLELSSVVEKAKVHEEEAGSLQAQRAELKALKENLENESANLANKARQLSEESDKVEKLKEELANKKPAKKQETLRYQILEDVC